MSAQFGKWNPASQTSMADLAAKVAPILAAYGPDSRDQYSAAGVTILFHAFHTTNESRREKQPHVCPSGAIIVWDGRLDNRSELLSQLFGKSGKCVSCWSPSLSNGSVSWDFTDVEIVAAAYENWGSECFAKLIGDWALSIFNPTEKSLLLVKDPIGTRHLFYSFRRDDVSWSTILDPLIVLEKTSTLCEEYIASWFSFFPFPPPQLTPYAGIHAVPPSCAVLLKLGRDGLQHSITKYWDFDPKARVRYRTDAEYEEHFRTIFSLAVQRRLRADRPILGELSGGMDSSSIVCIADLILAQARGIPTAPRLNIPNINVTPRLDTISWYYQFDSNMDERPYFSKVEERRRRTGFHIDAGALEDIGDQAFESLFRKDVFVVAPKPRYSETGFYQFYSSFLRSAGHRVVLSGIGGDDAMGRSLTPRPEFQNLLAQGRFLTLARRLNTWAQTMHRSRSQMLWRAIRGFLPISLQRVPRSRRPPVWLDRGFRRRNYGALCGSPWRITIGGPLPSFQDQVHSLNIARRVVAYYDLFPDMLHERRYPFLDRNLLEFMFAIPREQIVRPGERRSLMRRALVTIVPDEVLNRIRAPHVADVPGQHTTRENLKIDLGEDFVASSIGIIDAKRFRRALHRADDNEALRRFDRALTLEFWLRHLASHGIIATTEIPS